MKFVPNLDKKKEKTCTYVKIKKQAFYIIIGKFILFRLNSKRNWHKNKGFTYINKRNIIFLMIALFISAIILFIAVNVIKFKRNNFIKKYNINIKKEINHDFEIYVKHKTNIQNNNCYLSPENANIRLIHLVITRFSMEFGPDFYFNKIIYTEEYIKNGIRVLKKYLIPSLENQRCKNFTWIIKIGDKADMTRIKDLFDFNTSFDIKIVRKKDIKNYITKISKGFDVLITTSIDYDDVIYYNAVNDVRKEIDLNKPLLLHGYNRGVYYFEAEKEYYDFIGIFDHVGVMTVFYSLIINLNKVNETVIISDLGDHTYIKKTILKKYQSYGIKELNYDPTIFDTSDIKFIYVRQNYSGAFDFTKKIQRRERPIKFNLSKIYGNNERNN